MRSVNLRHSARAVILDDTDRVLLGRLRIPGPRTATVVWAAPGGGLEPGESSLAALRRELMEEVGLDLYADPPHIWHQRVLAPDHVPGYDGVVNDYFFVRTMPFTPRGAMAAAENISAWRWWSLPEIRRYRGGELFSPRDLAAPLSSLIADGLPPRPLELGL
jgi:8-oxo-dGTP diphosphatase